MTELENRFTYHPPTPEMIEAFQVIRSNAHYLAELVQSYAPESREKSLAITKIEEAVMWANAAIARNM